MGTKGSRFSNTKHSTTHKHAAIEMMVEVRGIAASYTVGVAF